MIRSDQTANYDLLYNKEYYGDLLYVNHLLSKKLSFRTLDDAFVMPFSRSNEGGIFDSEGRYVNGTSFREGGCFPESYKGNFGCNLEDIAEAHSIDMSSVVHVHSEAVYIGTMLKTWGHFITDDMRLLWFLRSEEYYGKYSGLPVLFLPALGFELKSNWLRMLEIIGVDCSLLTPVTELTRYDKIILPDECTFYDWSGHERYFTKEYVDLIDHVRDFAVSHSHPAHAKKIYFSYSKCRDNKSFGEDKLEKYFASKGYEIIYSENLTLDEQLNALVNCGSFASTIGSCSHNMLFLRDDTEVILIPRANYLTEYQLVSDQVHRQNIHYIDSSFSIFTHKHPWSGPFLYFVSSNLRKYFHDEDTSHIISTSDFWKYVRNAKGYKLNRKFGSIAPANNPKTYEYYASVAAEYFSRIFESSWTHKIRKFLKKLLGRK